MNRSKIFRQITCRDTVCVCVFNGATFFFRETDVCARFPVLCIC